MKKHLFDLMLKQNRDGGTRVSVLDDGGELGEVSTTQRLLDQRRRNRMAMKRVG